MNLRNLNINPSTTLLSRVGCSRYADVDDKVVHKATSFGLPLIGGTALELWAKATSTPGVRKRSDNDLDFISNGDDAAREFQYWVMSNVDPDKVKVDIMQVKSHNFSKWEVVLDGVLTMKLEYLLWSKLTRGSEKDKQDIKWILSIKELTDEEIQSVIDELGLTEDEANLLNECLGA